jgi:hypothetical protein
VFERVSIAAAAALLALAHPEPKTEPASKSWALCAASTTIVTGILHVPVEELRAAHGSGRYLTATVDVTETLKGERSEAAAVTFFSDDRAYAPKIDELIALDGKAVLVFLIVVPDSSESAQTYFAGYTADAARALQRAEVAGIRTEIARQARVLRNWKPHPEWPREAAVRALIEKMLVRRTQARAFRDLENLGPAAVPAIADLMDDRRRLGVETMALENPPDGFEAYRIYAPQLVVDALAAILTQLTGTGFGNIESGGTERQRRFAVDGWRVYADMQRNHPLAR